jgi:hypothetical protein
MVYILSKYLEEKLKTKIKTVSVMTLFVILVHRGDL